MCPDFEYFFRMVGFSKFSHTISGLFYFDLPVTIFLSFVFHQVVKHNLLRNLPLFFQRRFQDTLHLNFINYLKDHWWIFVISVLLGAASHLFWDSFTHNGKFFVRMFSSVYSSTYVPFDGANYPLFYVLQQVSTAIGLTIVGIYVLAKKPVEDAHLTSPKIIYWGLVVIIAVIVFCLRFSIEYSDYNLGNVVVSSITGLLIGVVCCGFINFRNSVHYSKSLNG